MKRVVGAAGYTIVETMIFLGVSALLFVSASMLITGKQQKTQFAVTVRDFSSKLQSVSGNVESGYYNSAGKVKCDVFGGVNIKSVTSDPSGGDQGTNGKCVSLGQVVVSPDSGSSDFKIISLVGLRTTGLGATIKEVKSLAEASPKLYTDTTDTYTLAGAEFVQIKSKNVVLKDTGSAVAFVGSLAAYEGENIKNGGSNTNTYVLSTNDTSNNGNIESGLHSAQVTNEPVYYCLSNGQQWALVTLVGGTTSYRIGDKSLCD